MIAGWAYGMLGEKAVLAQRYIAEHTPFGQRLNWSGELAQLESTLGVARSQAMVKLQELIGQDATATTELLWRTYAPYRVWYFFAAVGVSAALALFLFNRRARHWSDMNV